MTGCKSKLNHDKAICITYQIWNLDRLFETLKANSRDYYTSQVSYTRQYNTIINRTDWPSKKLINQTSHFRTTNVKKLTPIKNDRVYNI